MKIMKRRKFISLSSASIAILSVGAFGFNNKNMLCYRGRIDSGVMNSDHKKIDRELYNAMVKIKNDGIGPDKQLNSFGCSIKWK